MKERFILILMLFFTMVTASRGQNQLVDSLEKRLITVLDQEEKINILIVLSRQYKNIDLEKGLFYAKAALNLSEKTDSESGKAGSYIALGIIQAQYADYVSAIKNVQAGLAISDKINDRSLKGEAFNVIGNINRMQGNTRLAFDLFLRALIIFESLKDTVKISNSYNNLGVVHSMIGNYDQGLFFFLKALNYSKYLEPQRLSALYCNIGSIYCFKGLYDRSLSYYARAKDIQIKIDDKRGLAISLYNIGHNYKLQQRYEEAVEEIMKCLEINKELPDFRAIGVNMTEIGNIYFNQKKFKEAVGYGLKAEEFGQKASARNELVEVYHLLSNSYAELKDFKNAAKYHDRYYTLKTTLFNEASFAEINEKTMQYEAEKKEHQIALLNKDTTIKQGELKKQNMIKNAAIGSCMLIVIIVFMLFRNIQLSRYSNKLLQEKNLEISSQKENIERQKTLLQDFTLKLQKENVMAQYETLKNQVNPHFLFNSLNAISSLILTNPQKAIEFTTQFSKVYSYILELKENLLIKVEEELKLINSYLFLQKIRFGESLKVNIDISPKHMKGCIPPFSLQLLVENAIKHNIISSAHPLKIIVKSEESFLTVTNNLQKRTESIPSTGIGLKNLVERYHIVSTAIPRFWSNGSEYIANIPVIL